MAKNVMINGTTYSGVPYVNVPLADGTGNAKFVDTDSGDANAADLRNGKKAWVDGNEVTGTQPERSADDLTVNGKTVTVPAGIYDNPAEASVADGAVHPNAVVYGDEIGDTVSEYPITYRGDATMEAGYIGTGSVSTQESQKYIQVEEQSVSPSTASQDVTPNAGKLLKKVTVGAVDVTATATESDVLSGKTFFSGSLTRKTGTATVPIVGQDSVTKVLSIS